MSQYKTVEDYKALIARVETYVKENKVTYEEASTKLYYRQAYSNAKRRLKLMLLKRAKAKGTEEKAVAKGQPLPQLPKKKTYMAIEAAPVPNLSQGQIIMIAVPTAAIAAEILRGLR